MDRTPRLVSVRGGYDLRMSMMADRLAALPEDVMRMISAEVERFRAATLIQALYRRYRTVFSYFVDGRRYYGPIANVLLNARSRRINARLGGFGLAPR